MGNEKYSIIAIKGSNSQAVHAPQIATTLPTRGIKKDITDIINVNITAINIFNPKVCVKPAIVAAICAKINKIIKENCI